ncbi:SAM-dependent methyltransferase [Thiorhodovibrio frisius]|uniref:SAM-dependent methyltransferase n=1 Tax=Thiorhodovibrio frisius TaxID=631362 RepID=UPI000A00DBD5|nr:methyltransferase domain-containing protein [Thiorhodovibrio frisius]
MKLTEIAGEHPLILAALALKPGQAVADVGAGSGLFSLLFAQSVGPTGRVYAVDISEPFTRAIAERAAQAGLDQLVTVTNDQRNEINGSRPSLRKMKLTIARLICTFPNLHPLPQLIIAVPRSKTG